MMFIVAQCSQKLNANCRIESQSAEESHRRWWSQNVDMSTYSNRIVESRREKENVNTHTPSGMDHGK